jgi:hypothetical protein
MSKSFHWTANEYAENDIFYARFADHLLKKLNAPKPHISKHGNSYCYYYKISDKDFVLTNNDGVMLYKSANNERIYGYNAVVELVRMIGYE